MAFPRTLLCLRDSKEQEATSDSEVLTVAVVAAASFTNHHERALQIMTRLGYLSGASS